MTANNISGAHEAIEPIAELVAGHKNRLIGQGFPEDLACQMAADLHRLLIERMITIEQLKVAESFNQ